MQNQQPQSTGGYGECYERLIQHLEADYPQGEPPEELHQVEHLLDLGFNWEEAVKLIDLREHLYENREMRQRITNDSRMHFVRWLYENGEISED